MALGDPSHTLPWSHDSLPTAAWLHTVVEPYRQLCLHSQVAPGLAAGPVSQQERSLAQSRHTKLAWYIQQKHMVEWPTSVDDWPWLSLRTPHTLASGPQIRTSIFHQQRLQLQQPSCCQDCQPVHADAVL